MYPSLIWRKAPGGTSAEIYGWWLILLSTKAHLSWCRSTIDTGLTFRVISQTGSQSLDMDCLCTFLTWTKRIRKKITFFPSQQSIPNHFSLLVNFIPCPLRILKSIAAIFNILPPRVITLLRPILSFMPSTQPDFYPPTAICPSPPVFLST